MSQGNIVFLAANASYSHTNIAGWYLRGIAESAGWSWREVEMLQNESRPAALSHVLRLNPDILATSFYLFNHQFLCSFLSRLKALQPQCLIIGGGPEFLGDNRNFLERHREVNAVVRGEGEQAFAEWLECWKKPEEWGKIKGLCAIIDGNYIDNGRAGLTPDLDGIPSPFRGNLNAFKKPFLLMETSRGCSNNCAFCTSAGERVRFFSLERVKSDLALMAAAGVAEARIADRTFNEKSERCISLIKIMRDEFKNIRFHLEIDPARVSNEMIRELALAEPRRFHLEVGIQATRDPVLRNIGRFGSVERALAVLKQLCQLRNLAVHVDLIAGLPEAALTDACADLRAVALMRPDEIQFELLKVLPGTRLSREKEQWGIISAGEPPYEILQTAVMSPADIVKAYRLSSLVDWFYNASELQPPVIAAIELLPAFFELFNEFCGNLTLAGHAPTLENRFRLLEQFYRLNAPALIPKLGYAWLRCGLSAQHGICKTRPWKKALPEGAILIEGSPIANPQRIYLAELERPYLFVYGQYPRRNACAIYGLQASL